MTDLINRLENCFISHLLSLVHAQSLNIKLLRHYTEILFALAHIIHNLRANRASTLRGLFYTSVNLYKKQRRSNAAIAKITHLMKLTRRDLKIASTPKGFIYGSISISEGFNDECQTFVNCKTRIESMGCSISTIGPISVTFNDGFLNFVLLVEKETVYYRLLQCGIVERKDIATRELVHALVKKHKMIVKRPFALLCLTDFNPSGLNIALCLYHGNRGGTYYTGDIALKELMWLDIFTCDVMGQLLSKPHSYRDLSILRKHCPLPQKGTREVPVATSIPLVIWRFANNYMDFMCRTIAERMYAVGLNFDLDTIPTFEPLFQLLDHMC
ncbi:bifunctional Spo11-DNA topoisomerase VI subunit A/Spo11-DNA topoisomerase VI subunit A superfamily/Winged helix-like DNA-binding domain superfamily/Spo11-DNA topoisomerase VI [Babesia duncani]|uniref:DNA topoisomerase (ATP-hydrolyzing) n=1 Tax=Babesia duncani TaxID=323732 RepID=A0AAD9PNY7_9APIC|nr:bifunctional Spo11-DNA topoisomerase VI subunit A/Spo11-DNA topoisomerase VI subunit A superfamily/Winged helix-like DNA-binding domain superfamily/Spo11-DNA topoisomerase VI [Babesia duncani]